MFCRLRPEVPEDEADKEQQEDGVYLTGGSAVASSGVCSGIKKFDEEGGWCAYESQRTQQRFSLDGFFGPGSGQDEVRVLL